MEKIDNAKSQYYTTAANEMWQRACVIARNEPKREAALAVMRGRLSEYRSIPSSFLEDAVTRGFVSAQRVEAEIMKKDRQAQPGYVAKAITVAGLLRSAGVLGLGKVSYA